MAARRVTLDARYRQIHDGTGLESRYYAEPGHPGRDPHLRGTTSALRVIFGKGVGADCPGEFIQPAHGRPSTCSTASRFVDLSRERASLPRLVMEELDSRLRRFRAASG